MAGTAVDTALFPLDTLKTRLQSKAGFAASGGFRGVYSGLTSAVIGSAPGGMLDNVLSAKSLSPSNVDILPRSKQSSGNYFVLIQRHCSRPFMDSVHVLRHL